MRKKSIFIKAKNESTTLLGSEKKENCFSYLNNRGFVPFWHRKTFDENERKIKQNYAATFIFGLMVGTAIFISLLAANGFTKVGNEFLSNLSGAFRVLVALGTFGLIAGAVGALGAGAHYTINRCRNYKPGKLLETYETSNVHQQEVKACDPRRACFPATPGKTFAWLMFLTGVGLSIASLAKPDFFNAVKNSGYGLVMAEILVSLIGGLVVSAVFTGGQAIVATLWNKCCAKSGSSDNTTYFIDDNFEDNETDTQPNIQQGSDDKQKDEEFGSEFISDSFQVH